MTAAGLTRAVHLSKVYGVLLLGAAACLAFCMISAEGTGTVSGSGTPSDTSHTTGGTAEASNRGERWTLNFLPRNATGNQVTVESFLGEDNITVPDGVPSPGYFAFLFPFNDGLNPKDSNSSFENE